MKKLYILLGIVITIIFIIFRFNILGFYHEFFKGDIIDIGGYGKEAIQDVIVVGDEKYLLSVTDEYVDHNVIDEHILLTKLDNKNEVLWSKEINLIDDEGYTSYMNLDNLLIIDDILFFSIEFSYIMTEETNNYNYIVSYNLETESVDTEELIYNSFHELRIFKQDNKLQVFLFYNGLTNTITHLEYNTDFEIINESLYGHYEGSDIIDALLNGDDLLISTYSYDWKTETVSLMIYKLDLVGREYSIIDSEIIESTIIEMVISNDILYYSFPEDHWHQETVTISKYNLETDLVETSIVLDIPSDRNKLNGFNISEEGDIYVYGWEDSLSHVDSVYYKYNSTGKLLDNVKYSIGGIDSIKDIYFTEEEVILVILSKRIVDADYFEINEYNPQYDNFLRIRNK